MVSVSLDRLVVDAPLGTAFRFVAIIPLFNGR